MFFHSTFAPEIGEGFQGVLVKTAKGSGQIADSPCLVPLGRARLSPANGASAGPCQAAQALPSSVAADRSLVTKPESQEAKAATPQGVPVPWAKPGFRVLTGTSHRWLSKCVLLTRATQDCVLASSCIIWNKTENIEYQKEAK